jgi:hypothetical protein
LNSPRFRGVASGVGEAEQESSVGRQPISINATVVDCSIQPIITLVSADFSLSVSTIIPDLIILKFIL